MDHDDTFDELLRLLSWIVKPFWICTQDMSNVPNIPGWRASRFFLKDFLRRLATNFLTPEAF
jgi:hypothetical protein